MMQKQNIKNFEKTVFDIAKKNSKDQDQTYFIISIY